MVKAMEGWRMPGKGYEAHGGGAMARVVRVRDGCRRPGRVERLQRGLERPERV